MKLKTISQIRELWRYEFKNNTYYIDPELLTQKYKEFLCDPSTLSPHNLKQKLSQDRLVYAEFLESVSRIIEPRQ